MNDTAVKKFEKDKSFILCQSCDKYPVKKYIIDWGNPMRGQGKRSGGMVKGSMFDASIRGKKEYTSILGNLQEYADKERMYYGQNDLSMYRYLQARNFGYKPEQAQDFVIWLEEGEQQ